MRGAARLGLAVFAAACACAGAAGRAAVNHPPGVSRHRLGGLQYNH
jgi:hypothetical protein